MQQCPILSKKKRAGCCIVVSLWRIRAALYLLWTNTACVLCYRLQEIFRQNIRLSFSPGCRGPPATGTEWAHLSDIHCALKLLMKWCLMLEWFSLAKFPSQSQCRPSWQGHSWRILYLTRVDFYWEIFELQWDGRLLWYTFLYKSVVFTVWWPFSKAWFLKVSSDRKRSKFSPFPLVSVRFWSRFIMPRFKCNSLCWSWNIFNSSSHHLRRHGQICISIDFVRNCTASEIWFLSELC